MPSPPRYIADNWQNFGRRLTRAELDEIRSKMAGVHFSKECHDEVTLQMLYCAEALLRDLEAPTAGEHLQAISKAIQKAQTQLRHRIDHGSTDERNCPRCVALGALDSALLLTLDLQSSSEPRHNAVAGRA